MWSGRMKIIAKAFLFPAPLTLFFFPPEKQRCMAVQPGILLELRKISLVICVIPVVKRSSDFGLNVEYLQIQSPDPWEVKLKNKFLIRIKFAHEPYFHFPKRYQRKTMHACFG